MIPNLLRLKCHQTLPLQIKQTISRATTQVNAFHKVTRITSLLGFDSEVMQGK